MSALPPKADIVQHDGNVRFVPIADIKRQAAYLTLTFQPYQPKAALTNNAARSA
jgi:hypothetical protein